MGNAISACFKKYATFSGRATRSEYWYFYLFTLLVSVGSGFVSGVIGSDALLWLVQIGLFLPGLAAAVRRMHDVDKSGWFLLIPIYGLILACTASTPGNNRFGDPA